MTPYGRGWMGDRVFSVKEAKNATFERSIDQIDTISRSFHRYGFKHTVFLGGGRGQWQNKRCQWRFDHGEIVNYDPWPSSRTLARKYMLSFTQTHLHFARTSCYVRLPTNVGTIVSDETSAHRAYGKIPETTTPKWLTHMGEQHTDLEMIHKFRQRPVKNNRRKHENVHDEIYDFSAMEPATLSGHLAKYARTTWIKRVRRNCVLSSLPDNPNKNKRLYPGNPN